MQDIQITAQDLIDDLNTQVAQQQQELTYGRAEKTALIRRVEELEGIVEHQNADLEKALESLEAQREQHVAPKVIDGEVE